MIRYADVRVRLLPPGEHGRNSPIRMRGTRASSYKPHFRVAGGEWLGVAFLEGPEWVAPGEEAEATVELLYDGVDYSALTPGAAFDVLEGPHVVARGMVLRRRDEAEESRPAG
jgi:hypothetical protein